MTHALHPLRLGFVAIAAAAALACAATNSHPFCYQGWWNGLRSSCRLACAAAQGPSQCQASDCAQQPFIALLDDGSYVTGVYVISESARTLSFIGTPVRESYQPGDAVLVATDEQGQQTFLDVACTDKGLTLNHALYTRPAADLEAALDAAWRSGELRDVSF